MPDGLVGSRGFQLAVLVYWKWEAFSKNNENYDSGSVPIFFGWVRLGADIYSLVYYFAYGAHE